MPSNTEHRQPSWFPLLSAAMRFIFATRYRAANTAMGSFPRDVAHGCPTVARSRIATITLRRRPECNTMLRILSSQVAETYLPSGPAFRALVEIHENGAIHQSSEFILFFDFGIASVDIEDFAPGHLPVQISLFGAELVEDRTINPGEWLTVCPPLTPTKYSEIVDTVFLSARCVSKSELNQMRRKIARLVHPDTGPKFDAIARQDAMAYANARIDRMIERL